MGRPILSPGKKLTGGKFRPVTPAPVSNQSAVNVATATSKCSITFLLPYDHRWRDVKTKQDKVSNIL